MFEKYQKRKNAISLIEEVNIDGTWIPLETLTHGPTVFARDMYLKVVEDYHGIVVRDVLATEIPENEWIGTFDNENQ